MSVFSKYLKEAKEPTNSASSFIQSELDILKRNLDHIEKQLPAEINQLIDELRIKLRTGGPSAHRGIGTRIANWWKNLWMGADNTQNPYYLRNKLGAWGQNVEANLSLAEYRTVNELTAIFEAGVSGNITLLDRELEQLKTKIANTILNYTRNARSSIERVIGTQNYVNPPPVQEPVTVKEPPTKEPEEFVPTVSSSDHLTPTHDAIVKHGGGDEEESPKNTTEIPEISSPPAQAENESEEQFTQRVKNYIGDMLEFYRQNSPKMIDSKGRLKSELGWLSPQELTKILVLTGTKAKPTNEIPPETASIQQHTQAQQGILSDRNLEHVRGALDELRKRSKKTYSDEEQELTQTVWKPWLSLPYAEREVFDSRGDNGNRKEREGSRGSNNAAKVPCILPMVLRKDDPRIPIIKRYYPKVYKILYSEDKPELSKIERDDDTEETVQQRIALLWQRSDAIASARKRIKPTEGLVAHYLNLLREGGKPILRSEYISLPMKERVEYFKKLLTSG